MAGETNLKVNEWILEYVLYEVWQEYKDKQTLPVHFVNTISGVC